MRNVPAVLLALVAASALAGPVAPAIAAAPVWPSFQGGPAHLGVAADAPAPPYGLAWDVEAGESGHRGAAGPVVVGDLAVALGREEVVAVETGGGDVAWTIARATGALVTPAVSPDGAVVVYPEGTGAGSALVALDLASRSVRWRFEPRGEIVAAPAIADGAVLIGTREGFVHSVDLESGEERWAFEARDEVRTPVAAGEGLVYAISEDLEEAFGAVVFALHADTGKEAWRYAPTGTTAFTSAVTVVNGRVVLVMGDGIVRSLDARTGDEVWTRSIAAAAGLASAPAAYEDDVIVADRGGIVARFDGRTGEREWRFAFPSPFIEAAPLIVGGHVVIGRHDGVLVVIDGEGGRLVSDVDLGAGPIGGLAPAGDVLIAGIVGESGGLVAVQEDPTRELRSVESPTVLHPGPALTNYGIAAAAILGGFLLASRLLVRGPRRPGGQETPGSYR